MNPYFVQNYIAYQFSMRRATLLQQQQALLNAQLLAATEMAMEKRPEPVYQPTYRPNPSRSPSSIGEQSESISDSSSSDGFSPSIKKKMKQCRFCPSTFKSNTDLTRHERIHTGEKPFGCHVCGKQFNRKGNMEKHVTTHFKGTEKAQQLKHQLTNSQLFVCDCGKSFRSRGFYLRHMKRHEIREEKNVMRISQAEDDIEVDVEV